MALDITAIASAVAVMVSLGTLILGWRSLQEKASVDDVNNTSVSAQAALTATSTMSAQISLMADEIKRLNLKITGLEGVVGDCQSGRVSDQQAFSKERATWLAREDTLKTQVFTYLEKLVATSAAQAVAATAQSNVTAAAIKNNS